MTLMPIPAIFGCDVGKDEIVIHDREKGSTLTLSNEPKALAKFAAQLPADAFVVCEATGGYETQLLEAVTRAGRRAHRAHPRKVKAFIRSFGTLAKTDAIDARALARYGAERQAGLAPWQPPPPALRRLHDLVAMRKDLVADRLAWNNRLKAPAGQHLASHLACVIETLDKTLREIEAEIEETLRQDPELHRNATALKTVPGIGKATAATLLALMPELGSLNRKTAAALAGLAPHPNQSGNKNAYRRTRGGRPEVKKSLFMAAMVAAKHNKTLKAFYARLIQNAKKPILALTAVMRKLIIIANAVIRDAKLKQVS